MRMAWLMRDAGVSCPFSRTDRRSPNRSRFGRWTLAAGALAAFAASAAPGQSLDRKVAMAIDKARLGAARIGVSILDCQTGVELVSVHPPASANANGAGFTPASNLKLLTSGTAACILGPDYEFRTELFYDKGRVIVKGCGDPGFADPELLEKMHMSLDQFFDGLLESMTKTRVVELREVIVDDRVFDREYVHPDWPVEQLNRAYCAQVSGLNFYANILNVYVSPGPHINDLAVARSEPSGSWMRIQSLAKTVASKGEATTGVWLERDNKEPYAFRLFGTVRTALDTPIQVTVNEPNLMFAKVLADRLIRSGLGNPASPPQTRLCLPDEELSEVGQALGVARTKIGVVLERCNVDSDNLYAESLIKAAGHKLTGQPGSWSNGTAAVRMELKELVNGDMAAQLIMADGSGLSRNNRVTPEMITRWLRAMAAKPVVGDVFVHSLAIAGEEGTLRKRFKGAKLHNEVRAKSGYITKVRTLSGYVINAATGRRVAFSVLVDELPSGDDQRAKELHENIVEAIDDWLFNQTRNAPAVPAGAGADR